MRTENIRVSGMHCKECVETIEKNLEEVHGVREASASLEQGTVTVQYNPKQISLEQISGHLRKLGFAPNGEKTPLLQGVAYGLVPHIGCIGFILFSVLGVTTATAAFRPLLANPLAFYALIGVSFILATASAAFYLKRNGLLSARGATAKWKYLATLYGTTMAVNLILLFFVFPLAANATQPTPIAVETQTGRVTLEVAIPCPGHAPLITQELKAVDGVVGVAFSQPNLFEVSYDPAKTTVEKITSISVFNDYPAKAQKG